MGKKYIEAYVGVLVVLGLALAASNVYWYGFESRPSFALGAVICGAIILLGDVFPIRTGGRTTVGVWDVGLIVAIAALGPTWAAVAALPSAFYVGRRDPLRMAYEVGHSFTIVHLAGIAYSLAAPPLFSGAATPAVEVVYGTIAAGITLLATNKAVNAVLLKVKYDQALAKTWREETSPYLLSDAVNVLTSGLGVFTLATYGPATALVVLVGALGSQALAYRSRDGARENTELQGRVQSLEAALTASNTTFGTMIVSHLGSKDGFTHRHAAATAVYAEDLAREVGLDEAHAGRVRMAGFLHNIGLFGLPEELLTTTGKLNSIAQYRLAEHPARGEEALAAIPEFGEMARWVRWHHERPDGRGYPDKLRGAWIPQEASILAVAQAYAALILDDPARPGVNPAEARKKLSAGVDAEFDGLTVRAFLRILDTESEGYRMADDHRFVFPDPGDRRRTIPDAPRDEEDGVLRLPR